MVYAQGTRTRDQASDGRVESAALALRMLPKVELHAHLSGCMRLSTIEDLAGRAGVRFPRDVVRDLRAAVVLSRPARSYGWSFLPWKRVIDKVTADPANHYRITYEVAQDMALDGVVHAEIRTSVRLPFDVGAFREMLSRVDDAAVAAARDHGIDVRFVLGFNRQQFFGVPKAEQLDIVRRVLGVTAGFRRRVVGFDVWGNEKRRPPRAFADVFALIRADGYLLTVHAGETADVDHVRQAVNELQCRRVGHGLAAVADPELLGVVRDKEVAFEVCLTSNRLTGVVPDGRPHPVSRMVEAGVPVCLCADNTLVYDTTLSEEYARVVRDGLMTPEQVLDGAERAASFTFLPADERAALERRLHLTPERKAELVRTLQAL